MADWHRLPGTFGLKTNIIHRRGHRPSETLPSYPFKCGKNEAWSHPPAQNPKSDTRFLVLPETGNPKSMILLPLVTWHGRIFLYCIKQLPLLYSHGDQFMANNQTKSKKQKVVIWGASGHAMVVADIVQLSKKYELAGFLDDVHADRHGRPFFGSTILGGAGLLEALYKKGVRSILFGFGDCNARLRLAEAARAKGFTLATAVHPGAVIARDAVIGAGTVVCAGAVVNPGTRVGENVILNTSSSVNHECLVEDGVHIGPGVHLGGRVRIGRTTWIGIGATVKDRVVIGAGSIIGCGSLVLKDVPEGSIAYGSPARVVRKVAPDDLKIPH